MIVDKSENKSPLLVTPNRVGIPNLDISKVSPSPNPFNPASARLSARSGITSARLADLAENIEDEDIFQEDNQGRADFNEEFQKFKESTEIKIPFTMVQFEDVMYVGKDKILSLQYIFYQSGQKTTILKKNQLDTVDENGKKTAIIGEDGDPIKTQLGCENYQQDVVQDNNGNWLTFKKEKIHKMSCFNGGVTHYQDSGEIYESSQSFQLMEANVTDSQIHKMRMEAKEQNKVYDEEAFQSIKKDNALAEGLLSIFKTSPDGKMIKLSETSFSTELPFAPTKDGNMLLVQSNDLTTISLCYFNPKVHEFESRLTDPKMRNQKQVFKIMAWRLTSENTLEPMEKMDALNQSMCQYYEDNKDSFFIFKEAKFMSGTKHVVLTYVEKKEKNPDYETFTGDIKNKKFFNEGKGRKKKALKYVIFEVNTGKVVLEWGGVYFGINQHTGQYDLYHLGMLPVHMKPANQLCFFFAGKLLEFPGDGEEQLDFDWTLAQAHFPQGELTSDKDQNLQSIMDCIQKVKDNLSLEVEGTFRIRSKSFIYNQEWQIDISLSINHDKKKFGLLNLPTNPNDMNKRMYYVYDKDAKEMLESRKKAYGAKSVVGKDQYLPIADKSIPRDGTARHGRNFQCKSDVYFMTIKTGGLGGTGWCMKTDKYGYELKRPNFNMVIKETEHPYSSIDVMLYDDDASHKECQDDDHKEVIQSAIIVSGDQQILLKTKTPGSFKEVFKSSRNLQWQRASFPIISYNLGIRKLVIMNQQDFKDPIQHILQLQQNESFICFVEFNHYEDFGFYPDAMRIYGCANILYASKIGTKVHLNLVLFDPFYEVPEIAHLRSTHFIDYDKFNYEEDLIYFAAMAPTKKYIGDADFQIYMILQHEHLINRAKFVCEQDDDEEESDEDEEAFFDGDSADDDIPLLENVTMIQDKRNFLYYVVRSQGQCKVMEINPRDSLIRSHYPIYELKAERCYGLETKDDNFFIVDDFRQIHHLERIIESRDLKFVREFKIKQVSHPDFTPADFEPMCITEKYSICQGKIFYLYQDDPMPQGIFETEDLVRQQDVKSPQKIARYKGPIEFSGSYQFFNAYKTGVFKCHMIIYEKPDSAQKTLINDFMRLVDISSFLDDGKIFVKVLRRFMIFTKDGAFIDEIDFEQAESPAEMEEIRTIIAQNQHKTLMSHINKPRPSQMVDEDGIELVVVDKKKEQGSPIPIGENNMRDLLQFSQSNQYFLFINRLTFKMHVYKLAYIWDGPVPSDCDESTEGLKFEFKRVYQISFTDSRINQIYQNSPEYKGESLEFFLKTRVSYRVENSGQVSIILVRTLPKTLSCQVDVSIFNKEGGEVNDGDYTSRVGSQGLGAVQNFRQELKFDEKVIPSLIENFEGQKREVYDEIEKIKIKQDRLPEIEHDYSKIHLLNQQVKAIDKKIEYNLINAKVYQNLVVVWCGHLLKYAKINKGQLEKFKDLEVDFAPSVDIQRVIATLQEDTLQIIAEDHEGDYFLNMTWDFRRNMELTMTQQNIDGNEYFASYIVGGMFQRLNYYIDPLYVYDLEFNIPWTRNTAQKAEGESIVPQLQSIVKWQNQRKMFEDSSRFLDVERPYLLNYTDTRMDLLFWDNVQTKGISVDLLSECLNLRSWGMIVNGKSMWHQFAGDSDIIQFISDKYQQQRASGVLSDFDHKIPLLLLAPDNDGYSGLFHSLKQESPKSFELMCALLNDFDYICLSKMILKSLPVILGHESEPVYMFFESAFFKNNSMEKALFVPWHDDMDEFVFACNTSIISQDLVTKKLGFSVEKEKDKEKADPGLTKSVAEQQLLKEAIQQAREEANAKKEQTFIRRSTLKSKKLNAEFISDQEESGGRNINRVSVEVCEFDWLFEGDNVETLITILCKSANPEVLTTKTIKMFIKYMWDTHYQKTIIYYIFVPYIIYLFFMVELCSGTIGNFLNEVNLKQLNSEYVMDRKVVFEARVYTSFAIAGFMMFGKLEMSSLIEDGMDYFSDAWNCLDFTSLTLNFSFLFMATICQVFEIWAISKEDIRMIGAYACFLMWCKMFYWMRLFESTAYYVKLIQQTIADCMTFMLMILIILLAFANFFLIINLNMEGREDGAVYVNSYTGVAKIDALISAYFMGLGEFAYDGYSVGPSSFSAWTMFLMATFITCVVFMNMLIAIMGETFGAVTEKAEQSGLNEQINLINDHVWLLDLKKLFKNQRYLIRVSRSASEGVTEAAVGDIIQTLENNLMHKSDRLHNVILRRLETIDTLSRNLQKQQKDQSSKMSKLVEGQKQMEQKLNEMEK